MLFFQFEQAVAVAVVIELSKAPQLQSGFGVSFRIELDHLDPVGGDKGNEGNEMCLGHRMANSDEMLVFHGFHGNGVVFVRLFCFQSRQGDAAAADQRISGSGDHVAAEGAA